MSELTGILTAYEKIHAGAGKEAKATELEEKTAIVKKPPAALN